MPKESKPDFEPLTKEELTKLATYNTEVMRGLIHSSEWVVRMAGLQNRFNKAGVDKEVKHD